MRTYITDTPKATMPISFPSESPFGIVSCRPQRVRIEFWADVPEGARLQHKQVCARPRTYFFAFDCAVTAEAKASKENSFCVTSTALSWCLESGGGRASQGEEHLDFTHVTHYARLLTPLIIAVSSPPVLRRTSRAHSKLLRFSIMQITKRSRFKVPLRLFFGAGG